MGDERNNFDELERELREGLIKRDAPLGFSTRVMARVDARRKQSSHRISLWRWITVTALALALVTGFVSVRWQQQREERLAGEHARDQVFLALRITSTTLQAVDQKVQQTGKEVQP